VNPILSLSDDQLRRVMRAARELDVDKRGVFLTRLSENLKRAPANMTAGEFDRALDGSLKGLLQHAELVGDAFSRLAG
jgi:hypothetical protein